MENVIFQAKKAYYMVQVPAGLRDSVGNKIKPVYHAFGPTSCGFVYITNDPKAVAWIKEQDNFLKKRIWLMDPAVRNAVDTNAPKVIVGGTMSAQNDGPDLQAQFKALAADNESLKIQLLQALKGNKPAKVKKGRKSK